MDYLQINGRNYPAPAGDLTEIGVNAFAGRRDIQDICLPDSVREINSGAFSGCSALRQIRLPDGLQRIGTRAFSGCTALREIRIPGGLIHLGDDAFFQCSRMKKITLPLYLPEAGEGLLRKCDRLQILEMRDTSGDQAETFSVRYGDPLIGNDLEHTYQVLNDAAMDRVTDPGFLYEAWRILRIPAIRHNLRLHAEQYLKWDLAAGHPGTASGIAARYLEGMLPAQYLRESRSHPKVSTAMTVLFGNWAGRQDGHERLVQMLTEEVLDSAAVGRCIPMVQESDPELVPMLISYRWRVLGEGEEPADTLKL